MNFSRERVYTDSNLKLYLYLAEKDPQILLHLGCGSLW